MGKKCEVQFANEKVQEAYKKLDSEDPTLKKFIDRAIEDIKTNPFCGIQIPKKLIPKEYISKFKISNVWKYNLPNAWRLIYSVVGGETIIISIVVEWVDHKEYERRFHY